MRILHVITTLGIGGAEKLVSEIVPMLRDKGHTVDVCTFDGATSSFKTTLESAGINVICFGENCNVYNPLFIFKLSRLIRNYDAVHTHNTACQLFTAIASVLCSVVLVTTEHNTSNRRRDWKWYATIDRWMYNRYKAIICISEKTEENLRNFISHTNAKVTTIYNGINTQVYFTAGPLPSSEKNTEKKVLCMVAGFRYQKDQDTVIRALSILDRDKYELWLVGDGERRTILENLVADLDLDNVRFWGLRSNVPSILKSSDIVVMSSHWEGFGLAAAEGMAAGKPVIASNVDGLAQVVEGAGILFPHEDHKALAIEIQKLAEDKAYYQQVADRCQKRAQMYDIQKMVDGYERVYEEETRK